MGSEHIYGRLFSKFLKRILIISEIIKSNLCVQRLIK